MRKFYSKTTIEDKKKINDFDKIINLRSNLVKRNIIFHTKSNNKHFLENISWTIISDYYSDLSSFWFLNP